MHDLTLASLSTVERFVVCNLRLALNPHLPLAQRAISDGFRAARICSALPAFTSMSEALSLLWHDAQIVPDVHCLHCMQLGIEEWRLLQMLAALQDDNIDLARRYLRGSVPEAGIRFVLDLATVVAATLSAAQLSLRSVDLDKTVATITRRTASSVVLH